MKIISIVIAIAVLCYPTHANAEPKTYYVTNNDSVFDGDGWGIGSNSNTGLTKASPFLTIKYGMAQMSQSAGDTLIIANGIYTGNDNMISTDIVQAPPNGIDSAYTVIRADVDGGVVIDGEGKNDPVRIEGNVTVAGIAPKAWWVNRNYIELRGIIARNSLSSVFTITNVSHVKLINCGGYDAANGNAMVFSISTSEYMLVEGCYAWGAGRYKIDMGNTWHSIIRNAVVRHDRMNANEPMGGFILYGSGDIEVQNCIVVDSDQSEYFLNYYQDQGCFGNPGTSIRNDIGNNRFTNCIAVNNHLRFGTSDWGGYRNNVYYNNCIGWNHFLQQSKKSAPPETTPMTLFGAVGDVHFDKCTFGNVSTYNQANVSGHFWGYNSGGLNANTNEAQNSIIYNIKDGNIFLQWELSNNNNVYGLETGYAVDRPGSDTSPSSNVKTYNPTTNGLQYIIKTNLESKLQTDNIGATILKQYGKLGSLWGEFGYNLLQDGTNGQADVNLWPFPNENIIREHMRAYSYDDGRLTGQRGFCADGKQLNGKDDITLTSYIWEYLGNKMPSDIYGTHKPSAVTGLTVR